MLSRLFLSVGPVVAGCWACSYACGCESGCGRDRGGCAGGVDGEGGGEYGCDNKVADLVDSRGHRKWMKLAALLDALSCLIGGAETRFALIWRYSFLKIFLILMRLIYIKQ